MPAGEDEPVAPEPVRVGRVVGEEPLEDQVGRGRETHRGARVAVADLLDRIGRQHARRVDRAGVERRPGGGVERGGGGG